MQTLNLYFDANKHREYRKEKMHQSLDNWIDCVMPWDSDGFDTSKSKRLFLECEKLCNRNGDLIKNLHDLEYLLNEYKETTFVLSFQDDSIYHFDEQFEAKHRFYDAMKEFMIVFSRKS